MPSSKWLLIALLLSLTLLPSESWAGRSSGSSSHSSSGTTHVRGYVRKDGTYVRPHERRSTGSGAPRSTYRMPPASGSSRLFTPRSRETYRDLWSYGSPGQPSPQVRARRQGDFFGLRRDGHGRIERSEAAKDAFKRLHPCPSTGRSAGPCPGYVIDHVRALKHGGADDPSNMQWQTVEEARQKDRWE